MRLRANYCALEKGTYEKNYDKTSYNFFGDSFIDPLRFKWDDEGRK